MASGQFGQNSYYWLNGYGSPFGILGNQVTPWEDGGLWRDSGYDWQSLPSPENNYNAAGDREWMEQYMNSYSYPYAQQPNQGGASFGVWDLNAGAQVPELAPYGVEWASFGVP